MKMQTKTIVDEDEEASTKSGKIIESKNKKGIETDRGGMTGRQ